MGRFSDGQASSHGVTGDEAKGVISPLSLYVWTPRACTLAFSKLGIIFRVGESSSGLGHSTVEQDLTSDPSSAWELLMMLSLYWEQFSPQLFKSQWQCRWKRSRDFTSRRGKERELTFNRHRLDVCFIHFIAFNP